MVSSCDSDCGCSVVMVVMMVMGCCGGVSGVGSTNGGSSQRDGFWQWAIGSVVVVVMEVITTMVVDDCCREGGGGCFRYSGDPSLDGVLLLHLRGSSPIFLLNKVQSKVLSITLLILVNLNPLLFTAMLLLCLFFIIITGFCSRKAGCFDGCFSYG